MEKMLLIGGYGFVGGNIYSKLKNDYQIEIMSRFKHENAQAEGKDWIEGDITSYADIEKAIGRGYDYVVDLAGIINEKSEKHADVNIGGTSNIIKALDIVAAGSKVIYFSAINAEDGATGYFRTKREAEKIISAYKNSIIIRPSVIYGKYDFLTRQLVKMVNSNALAMPKSGYIYPVHIDDIVKCFSGLLGKVGSFNICGTEKLRFGDMFNMFRKHFSRKPLPQLNMKIFVMLSPILGKLGAVSKEQLQTLRYDFYRPDGILTQFVKNPETYNDFVNSFSPKELEGAMQ